MIRNQLCRGVCSIPYLSAEEIYHSWAKIKKITTKAQGHVNGHTSLQDMRLLIELDVA